MLKNRMTRFRAYQLETAGSLFSYFDGTRFTLIEARLTEKSEPNVLSELHACGKSTIDSLHITSWDQDHCSPKQLERILDVLTPKVIEYPGYPPHTQSGNDSLTLITQYELRRKHKNPRIIQVTPGYIKSLRPAESYGYNDVFHHPKFLDPESSNNNSTVKHFRTGSFNVLSLGDVESEQIASGLRRSATLKRETDIMILAHHGADNGFTSSSFVRHVQPQVAITSSNYGNQFDHPRQEIRELLYKQDVRLYTTKTGDVVVLSEHPHIGKFTVFNLKAGSTAISSSETFTAKKFDLLRHNDDTIRQVTKSRPFRGL